MTRLPRRRSSPLPKGEVGSRSDPGEGIGSIDFARRLRSSMTDAEARLWYLLRGRRFQGIKFRRQVPVEGFVVDFLCQAAKLIVELDGGQHAERTAYDRGRTAVLEQAGYLVLRFWNNDVLRNTDAVLARIAEALDIARGSP